MNQETKKTKDREKIKKLEMELRQTKLQLKEVLEHLRSASSIIVEDVH